MPLQQTSTPRAILMHRTWTLLTSLVRHGGALAVVLVLLGATPESEQGQRVSGEAQQRFLATWSQRMHALQSLHMVFTQEKQLRFLRKPLTAQGELWLKDQIVHYRLRNPAGDIEQELHMDSTTLRLYYPQLHTLEIIDLQSAPSTSLPLPFLSPAPQVLAQDYDIALFATTATHTLRLRPKASTSPVQELCIVLKDFVPQAFQRLEKNGTRVLMSITTFTLNPPVQDAVLRLDIPPGTTVTYPLR
jgi:outer membrane lipoprotein-sorting protein